jgi:hypothetical protein
MLELFGTASITQYMNSTRAGVNRADAMCDRRHGKFRALHNKDKYQLSVSAIISDNPRGLPSTRDRTPQHTRHTRPTTRYYTVKPWNQSCSIHRITGAAAPYIHTVHQRSLRPVPCDVGPAAIRSQPADYQIRLEASCGCPHTCAKPNPASK